MALKTSCRGSRYNEIVNFDGIKLFLCGVLNKKDQVVAVINCFGV